jgi:hypothetical protein
VSLRFLRSLLAPKPDKGGTLDEVRARLLPTIRDPLFLDSLRIPSLKDGATPPDIPNLPLAGFYRISIAIDSEASMSLANAEDLARWGIDVGQALAIALRNLAASRAEPMERVVPGLFRSPWQDNYDPSRLLLPQLIAGLGLRGAPVAMMPNRDCLLVADGADDAALAKLAELGRAEFDHPRRISAVPLAWKDDAWSPFTAGGPGPGARALAELGFAGRGQAYTDQKQHLEELHGLTGKDVFVASCSGVQVKDSDTAQSYCVWACDVETLLPRTDLIALIDGRLAEGSQHLGLFRWEDVERIAGGLFRPVGMTPERWLTSGFPAAEDLARITRVR